jgi:AmmeMemoRadiSam system protein A
LSGRSLGGEAKKILLKVARNALLKSFKQKTEPVATDLPELQEQNGAFVSLHKKGALRGCIGVFQGEGPLYRTVASMARAAAFEDPRFPPLKKGELNDIDIEISVLSPLTPIKDVEEIEVGKHGIYIIKKHRRGVLLPQVATEQGWDRETFLRHTCLKAGLSPDCWKGDVEIYTFTADIFGEKEHSH